MNLDEIHTILGNPDPTRWHRRWEGGTSYRYRLASYEGSAGNGVEVDQHAFWAVYRPNVNLTLAWGMDVDGFQRGNRDYSVSWGDRFPADKISPLYADVFWAGSLIDRFRLLYVDGGHLLCPRDRVTARDDDDRPTVWTPELTTWEVKFGELLSLLERGSSSLGHVRQAGVRVVDGGAVGDGHGIVA